MNGRTIICLVADQNRTYILEKGKNGLKQHYSSSFNSTCVLYLYIFWQLSSSINDLYKAATPKRFAVIVFQLTGLKARDNETIDLIMQYMYSHLHVPNAES